MANSRTRRLVPAAGLAALLHAAWLVPQSAQGQPAAAPDAAVGQPRPKVGLVLSSGGSASFYNVPGRI